MSCPICYTLPCDYGNSTICHCCGTMICGNCFFNIYHKTNFNCPMCRTSYLTTAEQAISGFKEICKRSDNKNIDYIKICLAIKYKQNNEYQDSLEMLEQLGEKIYKFKGACYFLAFLYRTGFGGKRESKKAFKLFLKNPEVGSSTFFLGEMFERGEGVVRNRSYGKILKRVSKQIAGWNNPYSPHLKTGENLYTYLL